MTEGYTPDSCGEFTYFEEDLVVTFTGDPSLSTMSQLYALKQSFFMTYNVENSYTSDSRCDPYFQEVVSVDIITTGGRRLSDRTLAMVFRYQTLDCLEMRLVVVECWLQENCKTRRSVRAPLKLQNCSLRLWPNSNHPVRLLLRFSKVKKSLMMPF